MSRTIQRPIFRIGERGRKAREERGSLVHITKKVVGVFYEGKT